MLSLRLEMWPADLDLFRLPWELLQDRAGRLVGIEVKAAASLGAKDLSGLHALAEDAGERFLGGVILYAGDKAVPFGSRIWALPVSALWA